MDRQGIKEIWAADPVRRRLSGLVAQCSQPVYLVGGGLRDILLNRPTADWDLALPNPVQFGEALAQQVPSTLVMLHEELSTVRLVVKSAPGERSQVLDFCALRGPDIAADLCQRDFTINALAWRVGDETEQIIDPCGGLDDLSKGIVRAVSREVLADDPLRLLRAFRLAAELDFAIARQTVDWISQYAAGLNDCAGERIGSEFMRLLAAPDTTRWLRQMDEVGLLEQIIPQIGPARGVDQGGYHHLDVWEHTLLTVELLEQIMERPGERFLQTEPLILEYLAEADHCSGLKLGALLHDLGKPDVRAIDEEGRTWFRGHEQRGVEIARQVTGRLRLRRAVRQMLTTIIRHHLRPLHLTREAIRKVDGGQPLAHGLSLSAIRRLMRDSAPHSVGLLLLAAADLLACHGPATDADRQAHALGLLDDMLARYAQWQADQQQEPLLTGQDLIDELDLQPGPQFGTILEAVEDARGDGQITTRDQALALARKLASSALQQE